MARSNQTKDYFDATFFNIIGSGEKSGFGEDLWKGDVVLGDK